MRDALWKHKHGSLENGDNQTDTRDIQEVESIGLSTTYALQFQAYQGIFSFQVGDLEII